MSNMMSPGESQSRNTVLRAIVGDVTLCADGFRVVRLGFDALLSENKDTFWGAIDMASDLDHIGTSKSVDVLRALEIIARHCREDGLANVAKKDRLSIERAAA